MLSPGRIGSMLSAHDNELVCRVGPGTPMGELMRRHWIPAAKASELVADGEPVRLMLLGEKLIAFRDTNGKVGVMDHECPHRLASLFYGRNEEGGLRCIYHGWKFDTEGNCLEMANVPCLLYTSDAADDLLCVDLGGRRIIKKKKQRCK